MAENPISPETPQSPINIAEKFIEFQLKEVEVKQNEIEFKKQQDKNNLEYAKESLRVQAEDFKNLREHQAKRDKRGLWLWIAMLVLIFGVIFLAMYWDKDDLLFKIIEVIALIFGGGATGYSIGFQKGRQAGKSTSPNTQA